MREVAEQIATLPPSMQDKSYRLMNRTMVNLQEKVRHALPSFLFSLPPSAPIPPLAPAAGCCRCGHRQHFTTPSSLPPFPPSLPPSDPLQVGFILTKGMTWETVLRLMQGELKSFREAGIDPLSESVARELFFVAASKVRGRAGRREGRREGGLSFRPVFLLYSLTSSTFIFR